ncbi:MAG: GNAT family protein [Ferruginibacter sp.]
MTIEITSNVQLELTAMKHAAGLFKAVDSNREHLSRFLPWVAGMQSVDDFRSYIAGCEELYRQQKEVSFVILFNNEVAGRIGLHHMNMYNRNAAIGYWLTREAGGNGIIHHSCKALIHYGFTELGLQRIELKAATENTRSQAVPQKLGFVKEGILRQAEWVNDRFLDLVVYSVVKDEWQAT